MRIISRMSLVCIIVVLLNSALYAKELNVSFHPQHTPVWCWAATIAMVGEFMTGQRAEDCDVLSSYDRVLGGNGTCCLNPGPCNRVGQVQEMKDILVNEYGLSGIHLLRPLTFAELKNEIDNNRPIIAALQTDFSGHVIVVSGYVDPDRVIVLDPMSGRHEVLYGQIRQNFQTGYWRQTLTVNQSVTPQPTLPQSTQQFCCDQYRRKRCIIPPGPVGIACNCYGIPGIGVSCQ